jgi:nucleoside-diphosphate-sugar epimerase
MRASRAVLVTGASGYLGSLAAATLLAHERCTLVLPVRSRHLATGCLERIRRELLDLDLSPQQVEEALGRAHVVPLPAISDLALLDTTVKAFGVDEILHCAGCIDYFDTENLTLVNVHFTEQLLAAAKRWSVDLFVYVSTAYCSGFLDGVVEERLHPEPGAEREPTEYTRTKREAERLIGDSGLPYLILRPSVVIGNSRTGRYTGKNYGLYQMWRGIEGLLTKEYMQTWHAVSPPNPINFVHQDAFQAELIACRRHLAEGAVVHLVSRHERSATLRDLCVLWAEVYGPAEIISYLRFGDIPLEAVDTRQRRVLQLTAKNIEISCHPWRFARGHLDRLGIEQGLQFADATLETITRCQQRYIEGSPRIRDYIARFAHHIVKRPRFTEWSPQTRALLGSS